MSYRRTLVALVVLVSSVLVAGPVVDEASAQYFGRNKVQYKDFDFSVLETDHFDIYFYESEREAAVLAARMAERWYARLSRVLDRDLRGRQPIVFYASHPDFEQTNAIPGQIGESTGGVTEFLKRRIVLPMAGSLKETDHVLGHELVHAFQFDITGQGPNSVGVDVPVALRMPLWFIEGMAEYLSVGSVDPFTTQWLRGALTADELPDFGDLGGQRYFPYRYGHALWAYVGGRFGDDAVGRILKMSAQTGNARLSFARVLGLSTDTLAADWHEAIRATSGPVLESTSPADSVARLLIDSETGGGNINMGPSLSPDGSELVFVSERGQFSVDLFLADAETGEVKNKITDSALDPHFESLQYLASSGAWSPDGERFALGAITRGRAVLAIFDPRSGQKLREIRIPEVGEIFNPTWGPEGRRIAFSAQVGGFTDLFMVDVESGERTRLTDDPFAELHPAWAPDGRSIAFVTDRFTSDLETLSFGDYRLALMDPETTDVRPVPGFESGKHINPQWTPDGRHLFFLAEPDGITDVFRVDLASGDLSKVTGLQTGISGITAVSPALSVARDAGNAVFSVHGDGNFVFDLYAIDDQETLAGEPVAAGPGRLAALDAGQLPPPERASGRVDELLADAELGLADPITFEFSDYSPALSLDYVGRPNLAVGADQFGFFIGGGGSVFFSDMLGNRNLSTLVQVSSGTGNVINSSALFAGYENRKNRWNWGILGGQIPQIARRFTFQEGTADGQDVLVFQDIRFWQVNREATGVVHYPFNRSQRVEFSAGARNIDFASEVRETVLTPSGQVLDERERPFTPFDTISSINTVRASAALVYDNSLFGATAPMAGQRYRFEVTPTAGSVNYYSILADYRRYLMPFRPFTLAGRALHFGRYGGGSEDFRLRDFFIGFSSLVRGYDAGTFTLQECRGGGSTCPVFDQLLGSRVGVFNAEARLPVLGGIGLIPAPSVPPVDLIAFFDAGVAWTKNEEPEFLGGTRNIVRSVGVGARMNLFGLLILELDYVNPLDRERKDWFWDLSLTPGF